MSERVPRKEFMKRSIRVCSFVIFLLVAFSTTLHAQSARLTGGITDREGQSISGASITVTNVTTGVKRITQTGDTGVYDVAALPSGQYDIRVEKVGFAVTERAGITLTVDTTTQVDIQLSIQHQESVVVHGDASMLQPSSPELATVLTETQINDLALIQVDRYRNPSNFLYLAPGTLGNYAPSGATNTAATNYIDVHGGQTQQTEIYMEGLAGGQMRTVGSFTEMSPPVDAVQEFKFTTALVGAQYGHTGDAIATFTLNSGTNSLHGSAYEYFRNKFLNANPWGSLEGPQTHQNEYGVTIGGPIVIPHHYDGHDRSFFFFSYGASRKSGADNLQFLTIPTPAEIGGNFSAISTPIYDPATTALQANGTYTRSTFQGNMIQSGRFDPVAAAIAKFYPTPTSSGTTNNYSGWDGEQLLNPSIYVAKVDHVINDAHRVSASFVRTHNPRLLISDALPKPLWDVSDQIDGGVTARVNYNWIIGPDKLNSVAVGLNRFTNFQADPYAGTDWPQILNLPGVNGGLFPFISFNTNGYTMLGRPEESNAVEDTYLGRDVFTWTVASHTLQFGGEFRRVQLNNLSNSPANSEFEFSSLETALPSNTNASGNSFASFLLGHADVALLNEPSEQGARFNYAGFFLQDDYKATPRLTLNAGIRWEFQTPPVEKNNQSSIVSLTTPNPGAGNLPGALIFAGSGPGRAGTRTFSPTDYSGLSGRVGLSFLFLPQTVVRAGYGLYYTDNGRTISTSGFSASADVQSGNNGITPAAILAQGFPASSIVQPALSPTFLNGQSGTYLGPRSDAMPRIQEWTANIQQGFGKNWLFELAYVGNHGTRLINPQMVNINQLNPQYLALQAILTDPVTSAPAQKAGIPIPYAGFTGSVAQALRSFPQYLTLTSQDAKIGSSIYNALEVVLTKRIGAGFTLGGNYSWSNALGYGESGLYGGGSTNNVLQNTYNPHAEWSLLPIDVRNSVTLHYIYDLPFGRGKAWLNQGGLMDTVFGGWRFSAIQKYQSGFPLELYTSNTLPIFNSILRPNVVPGVSLSNHIPVKNFLPSSSRMINPAAFTAPPAYTFGNASPAYDGLTEYSILNEDLSVMKQFKIKERLTWTWYGQFFNAFNRHRFTGFDTNFNDAGFGQTSGVSDPRRIQIATRFTF
jgi:hypothetical protein